MSQKPRKPGSDFDPASSPLDPTRPGSVLRLRHLAYLVLYCGLILWLGVITGLALVSGLLGLCLAVVFGGVYIYAGGRASQQDALLWALGVTADRGMPLAPTLDAVASQCRGGYRRKVLAAAHYLRQGFPLPEILLLEPGLFPRDAVILTRTGHDCGKLAAALRESATIRARLLKPWMALAVRLAYLFWVLIVLQMISGFIAYFILPKYEAIFADFNIPLPAITGLTIDVSHYFHYQAKWRFSCCPCSPVFAARKLLMRAFTLGRGPGSAPLGAAPGQPCLLPPARGARPQVPRVCGGSKQADRAGDPDDGARPTRRRRSWIRRTWTGSALPTT